MMGVTGIMFRKLGKGGTDREITWKPFAPQYKRKDGTLVPAWGGVPKVRGSGSVQPRKRPSGAPITSSSLLMQDTLKLRAGRLQLQQLTPGRIKMGPTVVYAEEQHRMRPWIYFTSKETVLAADAALIPFIKHLDKK